MILDVFFEDYIEECRLGLWMIIGSGFVWFEHIEYHIGFDRVVATL